jgi:adenylate cyclase
LTGARQHFQRALDLLEKLPPSPEKEQREVSLQIGLGGVLMQLNGWGSPEVARAYERAHQLCQSRGATPHVFPSVWNLWIFYTARARLDAARSLTDRLFDLARESAEPAQLLQAHHARWSTSFLFGRLADTDAHALQGVELCGLERADPETLAYGSHDTRVCAGAHRARALTLLGRPDAGLASMNEAVARARALDHPFTLAFAMAHAAAVHQFRREAAPARTFADTARRIADEHSFPLLSNWANCLLGWSMSQLGDAAGGLSVLQEGLRIAEATGSEVYEPHWLGLLAESEARAGRADDARRSVDDALAVRQGPRESFYVAELYRLRGVLRLETEVTAAARRLADEDFGRALAQADAQGARLLGRRAAISRARLWCSQGRREDARRLVQAAGDGIVGGQELPDAVEAAALPF